MTQSTNRVLERCVRLAAIAICCQLAGCSAFFVDSPADFGSRRCTSARTAPVVDSVFAGLHVVGTGVAIAASDSAYKDLPVSRGTDIALGLALTALFAGSAAYGFSTTAACRRAQLNETPCGGPTSPDTSGSAKSLK